MKKRLSFIPTVIIALSTVFVIEVICFWLKENLNWPDWTSGIFSLVGLYSYLEVASQLGPKEFNTPISRFLKLPARDKIVLLIATLALLIIALPTGMSFTSPWLKFIFFGVGILIFWIICALFGSKELNHAMPKGNDDSQMQR